MKRAPSGEHIGVTIGSPELGLPTGTLEDLDAIVAELNREQLALRTTAVLTGLFADLNNGMVNVSHSLAGGVGGEEGAALSAALKKDNALFVEPMQQLVLLRRCLTKSVDTPPSEWSDASLKRYFTACRYASDVSRYGAEKPAGGEALDKSALIVGAHFLLRLSLMNPDNPLHWLARMRLMVHELPKQDEAAKPWAQALEERMLAAFGIPFNAVIRFVGMLTLWSLRFKDMAQGFKPGAGIALNVDSWLSATDIPKEDLLKFFDRTARRTDGTLLDDAQSGGPISILPFRAKPFLQFADGGIASVYPPLVTEKLTYDLFWWTATPGEPQQQLWQQDWGQLVELYVVRLLAWIAKNTGCDFKADIKWSGGQVDAAMWFKGHVALFEISAGMMKDAEANGADPDALRDGLYRTLVRSKPKGKDKNEAIAQVAKDAKALLANELKEQLNIGDVIRVYPVVIAADRRVRVPGLRFWFDTMFNTEVVGMLNRWRVGALAVLTLEELETVEQMVRGGHAEVNGDPPGLIRLVRQWENLRHYLPRQKIRAAAWHQFMRDLDAPAGNDRLQAEADKWWSELKDIFHKTDVTTPAVDLGAE